MKKMAVLMAAAIIVIAAIHGVAATHYFQGFEVDTVDWLGATRVTSGTHGVTSAAGDFHAEVLDGAFTKFDGYESTFPNGGYTTSVDVYLDVDAGYANDTRFDWSSAISTPAATPLHRRDFVFNAGFYDDSDATGAGPRFVITASNNATRSGAFPKNPAGDPFAITQSGWYTFEHRFYNAGLGRLAVEMRITDLNGAPLHTWTLSDPTDVIGTTVGGHRYGWFVIQELRDLAIDNASLLSVNLAGNTSACKNNGWQALTRADGSLFNNQGDCIQYVNTGK
jgi:hypothetical protein